jgi:hypothetical protein
VHPFPSHTSAHLYLCLCISLLFLSFAAISVRESIPQPFCDEKKLTDSLILNGKATDPGDLYRLVAMEHYHKTPEELIYRREENPFYDAEVEEDLKIIQRRYQEKEDRKKKKLRKKMLKSTLASIPYVEYHADDVVIKIAKENDEMEGDGEGEGEDGEEREGVRRGKLSSGQYQQRGESETLKGLMEKERERVKEEEGMVELSPTKASRKRNGKESTKRLSYENVYGPTLGPLEHFEAKKQSLRNSLKGSGSFKTTGGRTGGGRGREGKIAFQLTHEPMKDESDVVYSRVMQPFEEYFDEEAEKETMKMQSMKEREEMEKKKMAETLQQEMERRREEERGEDDDEGGGDEEDVEERYGGGEEERYGEEYEEGGVGEGNHGMFEGGNLEEQDEEGMEL